MSDQILHINSSSSRRTFWLEWILLTLAGTLAGFTIIPAMWAQLAPTLAAQSQPIPVFFAIQFIQSAIQVAILVGVGLFFARRTGLGAPIIEGWLAGASMSGRLKSILLPSIGIGVVVAVIATLVDRVIFLPRLPGLSTVINQISGWQGILASFYGGILEELEVRLLVVSALAWLFGKLSHTAAGAPSHPALWLSAFVAAIIFALGHLPATALTAAITPTIIARSLVLNGGLGLVFGYLYWKRGLEAAMLAHFSTDFIVHFVLASI